MVTAQRELNEVQARTNRQTRLRGLLDSAGVEALLVSRDIDINYLTGFCGHDSLLLADGDGAVVVSDCRYDEQLNPLRGNRLAEVVIGTQHRLEQSIRDLCAERSIGRLGIQAGHLTVAGRRGMSDALPDIELCDTEGIVGGLRIRKDSVEIEVIEEAIRIAEEALDAALGQIVIGMTEVEFCLVLESEMKRRGASGAGFPSIVAAGPNGSLPHYEPSDAVLEANTSLLVDWGAAYQGYNSDLTRTFGLGSMPEKMAEIYAIVLDAQLAAIDACGPGKICAAVDAVARDHIRAAGYGDHFGHGLGHGLGMEVHEDPYFNELATEDVLEPGMIMTIEPGIYLPGVGGVRIEDDVLVTEDGCRVLSGYRKDLDSAILTLP